VRSTPNIKKVPDPFFQYKPIFIDFIDIFAILILVTFVLWQSCREKHLIWRINQWVQKIISRAMAIW
jgi:hypothetical protein